MDYYCFSFMDFILFVHIAVVNSEIQDITNVHKPQVVKAKDIWYFIDPNSTVFIEALVKTAHATIEKALLNQYKFVQNEVKNKENDISYFYNAARDQGCGESAFFDKDFTYVTIYGRQCGYDAVLHETLHALGFKEEQQRADRNNYINVDLENVIAAKREALAENYKICEICGEEPTSECCMTKPGFLGYDPCGVMHYDSSVEAWRLNPNKPFVEYLKPDLRMCTTFQKNYLTELDIAKLRSIYLP